MQQALTNALLAYTSNKIPYQQMHSYLTPATKFPTSKGLDYQVSFDAVIF